MVLLMCDDCLFRYCTPFLAGVGMLFSYSRDARITILYKNEKEKEDHNNYRRISFEC